MNNTIKAAREMLHGPRRPHVTLATSKQQKTMKTRDAVAVSVAHLMRGTRRLFTSPHQYKLQKGIETFR